MYSDELYSVDCSQFNWHMTNPYESVFVDLDVGRPLNSPFSSVTLKTSSCTDISMVFL